ncbi:MAG: FAD-binding oxidoreductase [Gemmatimonadota bacterium]
MPDHSIRTRSGTSAPLGDEAIERLASRMRGSVLTPDSPGYDEARAIWNAMIDRRPGLIARCRGAADVMQAVRFAREHEALVAVRGGGHNIAGSAVCDGGLMIDLTPMQSVLVDPETRTARVEPGCTLSDLDHEAQAFGLATPVGINSTTGIAGLTLGGGFGWLSRKHGMTIDNLLSADVVTAEGEFVRASDTENFDLFWAIRGGGGNFGVVTSFEFRLHPVGPQVLAGLVVHPMEDAADVLRFYRAFTATLSNDTAVWAVLRKAPPLPFLPAHWHGREVLVLAAFHAGDVEEGERVLRPLRAYGDPIADVVMPQSYAAWQKTFDPLLAPGARNYWKSHDFSELPDELLDTLVAYALRLPSDHTEIFIGQTGGAMRDVAPHATAYPHRRTEFVMNVHTRWEEPAEDDRCIAWAREFFAATAPFAAGTVYVNFLTEDEAARVPAAYGANHERLGRLKHRYDPDNLFRGNQNILPLAAV